MPAVAISGSVAQRPGRAGHAWVFVSYLLGFRKLGFDVLFLDRLEGGMLDDGEGPRGGRGWRGTRWLMETMRAVGLEDCYCLLLEGGRETVGISRRRACARLAAADVLLDFNGFLADEELLGAAPRRVYLDIDPGFAQMWEALGLARPFDGYDAFATVGANLGSETCLVPTGGRRWVPTRQPVLLDLWSPAPSGRAFTSVGSWRGPFAPVEYEGRTFGLRVHELRRFADLPTLVQAPFELALEIDPADGADRELLLERAWALADPRRVAADLDSYRRYVRSSLAELAIAKQMYVATRGGWFSDRSASYLASGKPVLAQDTGFGDWLPTGEGLLRFSNLEEAVAGAEEIRADPDRHRGAAREIAEEFFDSRKVLTELLENVDGA